MEKKVEIIISEGHNYASSVKDGAAFTSVDYSTSTYGGAAPCDTEKDVQRAIESAKKTIISEGDIPVVVDHRQERTLEQWGV